MTTEEYDLIAQLLDGVEDRLPVDPEARSHNRSATLAEFESAVASRHHDRQIEWGSARDPNVVIQPASTQERGRNVAVLLVAATSIAVLLAAVGLLVRDSSQGDEIILIADVNDTDVNGDFVESSAGGVDASDLIDGLTLDLPERLKVASSTPGRMVFVAEQDAIEVTVLLVDRWGDALVVESVPRPAEPQSLVYWLADSSTDESSLGFVENHAEGAVIEAWVVRLTSSGAASVGCDSVGPCGEIALSADGSSVSLNAGLVNELISIDLPNLPTLLVHASYAEGSPSEELISADLARAIVTATK
jgi:hypothetical protein